MSGAVSLLPHTPSWGGQRKQLSSSYLVPRLIISTSTLRIILLKPTGHVMHQQFNIQQLYVLPTLYLCVLYLSENKQRLVTLTA